MPRPESEFQDLIDRYRSEREHRQGNFDHADTDEQAKEANIAMVEIDKCLQILDWAMGVDVEFLPVLGYMKNHPPANSNMVEGPF